MIGVIDVGGGLRGAYGAGVFDYCLEHGIRFDYCIGVSAGSANCIAYIAGQKGRNLVFYKEYAFRKEYMSWSNLLKTGSYLDLDYIYGDLTDTDGEFPLDYDAFHASDQIYRAVTTDAITGEPVYFTNFDVKKDDYFIVKASSCVPVLDQPYPYMGSLFYDGGISDPVPIEKAFSEGCEKVVLILTKPRDYVRTSKNDARMAKLIRRAYPASARKLAQRGPLYNDQVRRAKELEQEGKVLIVAPKDISGMKTLTKDKKAIQQLYMDGFNDAAAIGPFVGGADD
ncbi:patatin-like phospholipase family protein [Catenisphaera adipataccumulans]|jgi:predicted patatin/cPLA2 family phospholipase|uniref:Putative patatin/cPLA2 family phospholipase n=1 Tax=Catenisphaera adipataccumulans TaxID=700500 RepID=A0A7W8CZ36_9FIRM|nr:patatin family protein [Catenisphaera adipataccumulans]MBB5183048.1 putative patatin/cPLA2 family phospholipase [Catenisphaera adipataccumulans]